MVCRTFSTIGRRRQGQSVDREGAASSGRFVEAYSRVQYDAARARREGAHRVEIELADLGNLFNQA